jgi:iron complex outermembrane receptor protein
MLALVLYCTIAVHGPAEAESTATESQPEAGAVVAIDEIIVTAQRRSERLQDVPVSITAVSGEDLVKQRIETPGDLVSVVPNLQAVTTVGEGTPVFSLRGVSMADFSLNQQSPVATYTDEVYKGSFPLLGPELYDIDRIEVLRGPQGTLYGKNTTGGAVNIISRKPGFDTDGYISLGAGNYSRIEANGAFQTALNERVTTRVAFTYQKADGWMHNLSAGQPNPEGVRQYAVRASFLYKASDTLDFTLRLSTSHQNPYNYGIYARPGPNGVGGGVYALFGLQDYFRQGLGRYDIQSTDVRRREQTTHGAALTTTWKLSGGLVLTSITSFDYGKLFIPEDADGSPLQVAEDDGFATARQFAEDVRLTSNSDGPLNFVAGAYYNQEKMDAGLVWHFYTDIPIDCEVTFSVNCIYRNHFNQSKKTTAAYADLNYKIADRIIVRGGIRATHDTGSVTRYAAQVLRGDGTPIANTIPGDPNNFDATTGTQFANNNVSGKLGIDFKTTADNLLYASISRGFRGSSFNAEAFFSPVELNVARPETVTAYEIGFKSQYLGRSVTLDGAVFYYDYKGQQVLNVDPTTLVQTLINVTKSRIAGGELELVARPTRSLRLNVGVGALNTQISDGTLGGVTLNGNRLPNAPALSVTAGVDWDLVDQDAGKVTIGFNGNMNSKQYFELRNEERLAQPAYALLNSQFAYRTHSDRFGVSAWCRNLTNKYYVRSAYDASGFGFDYFHLGQPRTYGITFDAKM